jgi:5-methylcytosine-specific restriction endonuclease McrA
MSHDVLVLNANFEPINICGQKRAFGLMMAEKAVLVINGRGMLHSVNQSFPIPSVIRLQRMVKRPRTTLRLTRKEVFRRDHYTCQYCGKTAGLLTIDHVFPRHLGGKTIWENCVTACGYCNHKKGGRTLQDSGLTLKRPPVAPPQSALYKFGHNLNRYTEWTPFLEGW